MNFSLFILLNAILLLRPEELFPEINGLRLYLITIVLCTATSLDRLGELLTLRSLAQRPVAVCVLLFFASTIVSLCARGRIEDALFEFGPDFAKVILYYFLLLATVDTPGRFRVFVTALVVLIGGLTAIAFMQHYGVVEFPLITPCLQREIDPVTGEDASFLRMVSSGIFNDPNDLCMVLGLGILSCVYLATTSKQGRAVSLLWVLPIPFFFAAVLETHSRGGLLGILAGGAAFAYSRFGGPKALPYVVVGAVGVLLLVGGRQAEVSGGTAHERLMLWADGVSGLLQQPLWIPTGLGMDWFEEEHGLVAHNSFVQAYVELGAIGGGAFLGAFYFAARILDRCGRGVAAPGWVVEARHYGFAVLVGYAMGCYSLTRNYVVPTYLVLGLASVLLEGAAPTLPEKFRVSGSWFGRMFLLAICGLVLIKLATQAMGLAGI